MHLKLVGSNNSPTKSAGTIDQPPPPPHDPGMDDGWRTKVDERLTGLDKGLSDVRTTVAELKGDVSGLKLAVGILTSAMALGFAVIGAVTYSTQTKVDALGPRITEEFRTMRAEAAADARAMRAEQAAQTSAIANAITATKQQAPQVILVPAPSVQQPALPQP